MTKTNKLIQMIQPIADALNVGFYGEDGQIHMEKWQGVGITFPTTYSVGDVSDFLSMEKSYKITSNITNEYSLIAFRITGNLWMFVYFSWKADRIYIYIVDGELLRLRVNRLSSTMIDRDLELFLERVKNSFGLEDALGNSRMVTFAKYINSGESGWAEFVNKREHDIGNNLDN